MEPEREARRTNVRPETPPAPPPRGRAALVWDVGAASNDPLADARVAASADAWRRKLLDLSKRNRALNFRPTKVSTIAIVDEPPAEVFRSLYLRERSMRFKAAATAEPPPRSGASPAVPTDEAGIADEEEGGVPQPEFVPYDAAALDERHTDDWLQTASTPEALDKSLRRLDEQSLLSINEQGVNTLFVALGMLHYTESEHSAQVFRAPLVLLPVKLVRSSARSGYSLRASDDEPMVNPALAEYLRREHAISLPPLPDSDSIPDDYDLQALFTATANAIAGKQGWGLKTSVYLGLFAFQKLVMYKDLELNERALTGHRIIREVVLRTGDEHGGAVIGLPPEIRALDLDTDFPPESTYQVVDADSSQLRAIAAVAKGHDVVIEGPPGTGKSQTITNLIAQAIAAGKSVLFVAEKMAALQVVHDRLVRAGLGEFCLELHSTKANKRAVMKELAAALDASLERLATPTTSTQRLPNVRADLRAYVEAVHETFGSLARSPWQVYGELAGVLDAPRVSYMGAVDGSVTQADLDATRRSLRDLAAAAAGVGVPSRHPWRESAKTFFSEADLDAVSEEGPQVLACLTEVAECARAVAEALGLPEIRTLADVDSAGSIADVLARSPGAPLEVLQNSAWNAPPAEATGLIAKGRAHQELSRRVLGRVTPDALDHHHADDIAYVERKTQRIFSFLAMLDGRYRAIARRWKGYRLPTYSVPLAQQVDAMRQVDRVRAERDELDALFERGRGLFGDLWQGWRSDWDALDGYTRWVVEFRQLCVRHGLSARPATIAACKAPDVSAVKKLEQATVSARGQIARFRELVGWPKDHLGGETIEVIAERTREILAHAEKAPRWAAFEVARRAAGATLARELLPAALSGEVRFEELDVAFRRAFWMRWLTTVIQARPALERFHSMTHEQRVAEFRDLDERVLLENRARLIAEVRERVQHRLREPAAAAAMPHLRREMARQRGLAPLRRTMFQAGPAIRAIKPCLLMSPLTVAQLLDGQAPTFDLAIFDEASQLPPEDAVGAIVRARQLVVVGDPKQLPPTNFFAVASGTIDAPTGEDGTPLYEDAESILEHCTGAGFPSSRLRWHYRSAHESLISFSNVQFYDADLYTFPSVDLGTNEQGLQFEHVADGVYTGQGLNLVEARRVADAVVAFARKQLRQRAADELALSLGVGTFNLRQQLAVQDELEQRRRDDPSIEPFFDRGAEAPFFVKNLENIQGDERDVIFLSVTYARALDGRLRYNFGPLNGENGWRRLNVLTTRARQRMRVFSSMRADEINAETTTSRGARLLREFLLYAEYGRLESESARRAADTESPFERDVLRELTDLGVRVVPQVGASGYRIDLGVVDDAVPGRYVCGIECDGVAYHASETARDRDRLRQQVLEARGWTIHRVWSTDWFKDRKGQIERLARLIEEDRRRARDAHDNQRHERNCATGDALERAADSPELASADAEPSDPTYVRPVARPYQITPWAGHYNGSDLLEAPLSRLLRAVVTVVTTESPVHADDVVSRVVGMWGSRAGSRIRARIDQACDAAVQQGLILRRGAFLWSPASACEVRSRTATRIPAERVAPEEYEQAVLAVLRTGRGFTRSQLANEVRAVLGYGRTGAALDEAVGAVVSLMLADGRLGEGSIGLRLRL